jgi:uridine kinase
MNFQDLASELLKTKRKQQTLLIAIDGHGGTGKSTFAQNLASALKQVGSKVFIVSTDEFGNHKDLQSLKSRPDVKTPYRIDSERLRKQILEPLSGDILAIFMSTDWWDENKNTQKNIDIGGVVIVEGCYSLGTELREYYDFRIFIDTPLEEASQRASDRDIKLGGKPDIASLLWKEVYYPNELVYMKEQQPKKAANLVVTSFSPTQIITAE